MQIAEVFKQVQHLKLKATPLSFYDNNLNFEAFDNCFFPLECFGLTNKLKKKI